ncbi:peroxisome assembly protein (Peroxin-2) [Cryptotrichosporon argae]
MDAGPSHQRGPYVPRPPRVSQVDADELDGGLVGMLAERLDRSLSNFANLDLKPELDLLLKLFVFRFGVLGKGASPGAAMQNLKLVTSSGQAPRRRRLALYVLLYPPGVPAYLLARARRYALARRWPDLPVADARHRFYTALDALETASKGCELLGWLAFLWDARYPSLLMRLLRLRLVPAAPHLARMVSYEFMNRQLVWGAVTEFLMFAFPLLPSLPASMSPSAVFAPLRALTAPAPDYAALPPLSSTVQAQAGPLAHLPPTACAICHARQTSAPAALGAGVDLPALDAHVADDETAVFVPARADCRARCEYCWYCIHEALVGFSRERDAGRTDAEKWSCLRCGGGVGAAMRVGRQDEEKGREDDSAAPDQEEPGRALRKSGDGLERSDPDHVSL